jgi:hypothetical protein
MQIRYHCPTETCVAIIEYEPLEECGDTMECPRCHTKHPMTISEMIRKEDMADRCAVCDSTELFVRKDFPQALGFAIVVVFGLIAIYYFTVSVVIAWSVLGSAILLDLIIYSVLGRVTTCYACRAEYRKCKLNPAHEGFDLATSEKY